MAAELIVDFPPKRNHDVVQFAETSQLYVVERHDDISELWCTKAEYNSMKRNVKRDVLQARASDSVSEEDSGLWIGIAHLLTPACMLEVQAYRRRCVSAVLAEKARARQDPSVSLRWEHIALASLAETRKAESRARILRRLHKESI